MNLRTIGLVIGREYNTRVRKKSFLILTFIVPILFAAMCFLPSIIMLNTKEKTKEVAVVDRSGIVMPFLENGQVANWYDYSTEDPEELKGRLDELGKDILVVISPLDSASSVSVATYSSKPAGVDIADRLSRRVSDAVEDYRVKSYDIKGLQEILSNVKAHVKVQEYTLGQDGRETISESGIFMVVSMVLGMLIYMFVAMFSGMVMSSVIEEKSSRVVEVLVSSVKSIDLMFGKIIGVALVALTQFALWIVLTLAIVGIGGAAFGPKLIQKTQGLDQSQMMEMASMGTGYHMEDAIAMMQDSGLKTILTTLQNLPWAQLILAFLVYFILGYLLYASMFAAVGSAVENEADSTQLQLPITIPLLIGFFIALMAMKNPYSQVVWWGSMIPFTSPIVMLARIPYGVPGWELILSMALLLVTFALIAWASAKVYRAGILIFGKKSTWSDLWKWLKQK